MSLTDPQPLVLFVYADGCTVQFSVESGEQTRYQLRGN